MAALNHIHTYRRYGNKTFKCDDPLCTHIALKNLIVGKASLCNNCHSQMVLSREDLRRSRPLCFRCGNTKKARSFRRLREIVTEVVDKKAS